MLCSAVSLFRLSSMSLSQEPHASTALQWVRVPLHTLGLLQLQQSDHDAYMLCKRLCALHV